MIEIRDTANPKIPLAPFTGGLLGYQKSESFPIPSHLYLAKQELYGVSQELCLVFIAR